MVTRRSVQVDTGGEPVGSSVDGWQELRRVIDGPLPQIAVRFSRFLSPDWPHQALVIFTRECTGRPRKVAGDRDIVDRVTIDELDTLKDATALGDVLVTTAVVGGVSRTVHAVRDESNTLLVLILKPSRRPAAVSGASVSGSEASEMSDAGALLRARFAIVATSIRQQVAQASPDYLAESRAASSERARTIAQLTQSHEDALASILGTLRSRDLDDRTARATAAETASSALIALRSVGDTDRKLATEALPAAFARMQTELEPVLHQLHVDVEYVRPSESRSLPGEIAHAARAIVRVVAVAFGTQRAVTRVRVAWECVGDDLVVDVRDQGAGELDGDALTRQLSGRLRTLDGRLEVETLAGWGSRVSARIPLDSPGERPAEDLLSTLNPRELEVLGHLALGRRNKSIATELGVSESTVKFHVTAILQKLQVSNRGEAGLLAAKAGITAS
ncbi:LuxR C-terminal-related transcriptional regulator [Gordonia sp. ABSL11-1]|uniref:helix-turn-helix transcriptional regulator n=1 Tax=Gordonia sp. ABSL11-1 TaxID=3053924 RepID=UPI0025740CAC|nr:LuxR C-terminal-related transcriptional regulator [Gordonia sp. ABSL11-1]MDL9946964.1 LuxR C-terminal-related transcriptional regulator [Gordonia sp. ABSL11-1]